MFRSELDKMLFSHLHKVGIQTLEDPKVNNLIQRSQQWLYDTYSLVEEFINLVSYSISAIISGAIIFSFFPLMIPVLLTLTVIQYFPDQYFTKKDFHWQVDNTEKRRLAFSYSGWLSDAKNLQEITIVGAYEYFKNKYLEFFAWYNGGMKRIIVQRQFANFALSLLDTVVSLGGYVAVFVSFIEHKISIGTLSFQVKALDTFGNSMQTVLNELSFMNEFAAKMKDVVDLFAIKPAFADGTKSMQRLKKAPEVQFKDVSFAYPQSEKVIIDHLNLHIKSGEKVAIVGHNGAGKTTLVKLLSRIYTPQSGIVEINGTSISEIKTEDWYKNIGVLFQDYNFYGQLSPRENIYLGDSLNAKDEERIVEASKNADAHNFIMEFPKQYDQILSERYEGGIRPSSGQQQKISIARFFYRNAPLVIFDEPTAAIDAVSEYNIFNKIYEFFKNKTVVIISHRFSTVRNADRIIVMEKGQIAEEGSHKELMKKGGIYAHAFKLQAEGYQDEKE
jgi:ABC-type multidrug transport system fused ATPase/permease subunit